MAWVAGADGCKAGWVRVCLCLETRRIHAEIVAKAESLLTLPPEPALLAIDVPIGLPDAGSRDCDVGARRFLGQPRGSSVFPAPVRPVLRIGDYRDACAAHEQIDGRGLSRQVFAILPKIREVDDWLRGSVESRSRVFEIHPEVSFSTLAGEPIREPKRRTAGRQRRRDLLAKWVGADAIAVGYASIRGSGLVEDDYLDALAAAWTAERVASGAHETLPAQAVVDSTGLPMRIIA
jgi:predicted RNase H-like nuclease